MRKLYFLLPGTDRHFACGGLWAELKIYDLARQINPAAIVTYRQREAEHLWLEELLGNPASLGEAIFILSWGFDVPKLVRKISRAAPQARLVYHAHSAGYGFRLPPGVPIIAVSRNTLGYWGQWAPASLLYYLPNEISLEFRNLGLERDIDVLVQTRKSSEYLIRQLVPALQKQFQVFVVDRYIEDLPHLFNRAKIYLYDSAEYWAQQGLSEGFGLPPLEAMACGCWVFSSLNGALADYLDPGFNCHKIAGYALEYDLIRIARVLADYQPVELSTEFMAPYRRDRLIERLGQILKELNHFFDQPCSGNIAELHPLRLNGLRARSYLGKLKKKVLPKL
jgi:glycosyltransferase involved in cell wall biosynthesis